MVPVARRYLFSDKVRLAISAGGVAFAVLLIVLILALYRGIYEQAGQFADASPADLWLTQAGAPDPAHGASVLSDATIGEILAVPGVEAIQPLMARTMQVGTEPNQGTFGFLIALPEGPFREEAGHAFGAETLPEQGQIILSDIAATRTGASSGDTVYIGTWAFEVAEVAPLVEAAFSSSMFVHPADAAEVLGLRDAYSFGLVAVAPDADIAEVETAIEAAVPGTNALTRAEFANATRREVEEGFLPIVAVLTGVAFVVGLAVIALTIYSSTIERVRDYGVLKAVGAAPSQLFGIVIRQSVVIALIGFAVGLALGFVGGNLIQDAVPEFATLYRWQDALLVFGVALAMSAFAAIVPVRRVARVDPAIVFRA